MNVRHSGIIIRLVEHLDKNAVFYDFTLKGVSADQVIPWLEKVLADLKGDHTILMKEVKMVRQRDIGEVLEKIIREVPGDLPRRSAFVGVLRHIVSSSRYTAPEAMAGFWNMASRALEEYVGDPDEEWKRRIASIFAGRDSL